MVDKVSEETDLALVQRAASGDVRAFDLLMHRHNQRLFRAARGILHDDAEAEEAIQDAWWNAYQHFKEFRADSEPLTWLTRIAINESLARLRRNKSRAAVIQPLDASDESEDRPSQEERMPAPESIRPENQVARKQLRGLIESRVNELPDKYRSVFMLRGIEGMEFGDVASLLGLSPATVRVRFMRARGLLRKALQGDMDFSASDAFEFAGARCDRVVAGVHARLKAAGVKGA
ncbi:MAG: RNA polymerase sigma factor [Burkholderiaceae bacterium]|jgi:RNA polymerase sigma-70 factor (ECF subfamily)|nr:MAG: RNA polymerase sigma factor [Burkholderiaceae bacterium]